MFATDSVERYAIDYNRGHISSAVATLSLLGILGYIRALVKLAVGADACDNAGLNVNSLRPLFGIPAADRLPSDEIYEVHYMQRHESNDSISWKESRTMKHTLDSMGILSEMQKSHPFGPIFRVNLVWCKGGKYFMSPLGDFAVLLLSSLCIGPTSCLLIPLREPTHTPTWSLIFATAGLFFPVFTTSLIWAWVFAQEQLPPYPTTHALSNFAYIGSKSPYFILPNLKAIEGTSRSFIRAMSLIAALIAIVG